MFGIKKNSLKNINRLLHNLLNIITIRGKKVFKSFKIVIYLLPNCENVNDVALWIRTWCDMNLKNIYETDRRGSN